MLPSVEAMSMDVRFPGFCEEAFAVLDRLKEHPHIGQYREEKRSIATFLMEPFRLYRDDLAVNWVLPNRLPLETEKNVFSRLLKNDFGAGGCNHHLWMSFYRLGRSRLRDLQMPHTIDPDGFSVGLYAGDHAREVLRLVRSQAMRHSDRFRDRVAELADRGWSVHLYEGTGARRRVPVARDELNGLSERLQHANGLWIATTTARGDVVQLGPDLVHCGAEASAQVWPLFELLNP